ncbi:MAG: CHAT domain-containing protein, partial [Candidatus Promineifilaceae bacterium]
LNQKAELLLLQSQYAEAFVEIQNIIELAKQHQNQEALGNAYRLLGTLYYAQGEAEKGLEPLQEAHKLLHELHFSFGEAKSLLTLGNCHLLLGETNKARATLLSVIQISSNVLPSISWQAHAQLAQIAKQENQPHKAVKHLQIASKDLANIRNAFWQPHLLHHYWLKPAELLNQLIETGREVLTQSQLVTLITNSKAITLQNQLTHPINPVTASQKTRQLKQEIYWQLSQLENATSAVDIDKLNSLRAGLHRKISAYQEATDRLARQTTFRDLNIPSGDTLAGFQQLASRRLSNQWIALQYHLDGDQLYIGIISADMVRLESVRMSPLQKQTFTKLNTATRHLTRRDLERLGQLLIPRSIKNQLTPTVRLLIAPHKQLHQIPWPALMIEPNVYLVERSIPIITPSITTTQLLWQRVNDTTPPINRGLIIAISEFAGDTINLPDAKIEGDSIQYLYDGKCELLENEEATFARLRADATQQSLAERYSFLHFATHADHDSVSGYLSRLTLADQEVSLHELQQLAPLPKLVTYSACSGAKSHLLSGDEHVGLVSSAFAAGTQQCIAHLWQVQDAVASQVMAYFHGFRLHGISNSEALARAQRRALSTSKDLYQWGGYLLYGEPD